MVLELTVSGLLCRQNNNNRLMVFLRSIRALLNDSGCRYRPVALSAHRGLLFHWVAAVRPWGSQRRRRPAPLGATRHDGCRVASASAAGGGAAFCCSLFPTRVLFQVNYRVQSARVPDLIRGTKCDPKTNSIGGGRLRR